jgi:acetyltransferase-like isoleucine patch superfamily enzyme
MSDSPRHLEHDWYAGSVPANVTLGREVYLDTAYGFAPFHSTRHPGLVLGDRCGAYDRTTFVVGPDGQVTVGPYTCLNGTYLYCNGRVTIGAHCLLAWGVVVTDTWLSEEGGASLAARRAALRAVARDPARQFPAAAPPRPITLEDNVWVGFDAVILPGVTLGRGCVVGCKTVVQEDVPSYAVLVGDPPRIVRFLEPDDNHQERERALQE